ncbi:MAG: hypothetical protein WDW36_008508 [Sanguina aurantia]
MRPSLLPQSSRRAAQLREWLSFTGVQRGLFSLGADLVSKWGVFAGAWAIVGEAWSAARMEAGDSMETTFSRNQKLLVRTGERLLQQLHAMKSGASYRMVSDVMRELQEDTHLATDTAAILLGGMGSRSGSSKSNRDHSDQPSTSFGQTLQSAFQTLHR